MKATPTTLILAAITIMTFFMGCKVCSDVEVYTNHFLTTFEAEAIKANNKIDDDRRGHELERCDSIANYWTDRLDSIYQLKTSKEISKLVAFATTEFRENVLKCDALSEGSNYQRVQNTWEAMGGDEAILGTKIKTFAPRFYEALSARLRWLLEAYFFGGERHEVFYNGRLRSASEVEEDIVNLFHATYDDWLTTEEKRPDYFGTMYREDVYWKLYNFAYDPKNITGLIDE